MGFLGDILSTAVNIVNIPAEMVDKVVINPILNADENFLSTPLVKVSKIVKKVDE